MTDPLMMYIGLPLIKGVVILGVLLLTMAYLTYAERKILAYMQVRIGPNRVGPRGWLQPIADGLKLFVKEDLVPGRAERFVFVLAPILIFAPAILVWAVIPWGEAFTVAGVEITPFLADINIAILFVLAVSTVGVYGLILGGWASNNKFSLMGGLRSAAQMISYEVPMGFAIGRHPVAGGHRRGATRGQSVVHFSRHPRLRHLFHLRRGGDQPQPLRPARGRG